MTTHTTWEETDEPTTVTSLASYAFEYIAAARSVNGDVEENDFFNVLSPVPAYFLVIRGIEPTFKGVFEIPWHRSARG